MTATNLTDRLRQQVPLADTNLDTATALVSLLLDEPLAQARVCEASVYRPKRGRVWVASFTGPAGGQVWRTTGLVDREEALALAKEWEAEARAQRVRLGRAYRKPTVRVSRTEPGTKRGPLSQREVALFLNMSERGVRAVERRAFQKLRQHPALRRLWQEYTGNLDEEDIRLTLDEIEALFQVARTPEEQRLVRKVLALIQAPRD